MSLIAFFIVNRPSTSWNSGDLGRPIHRLQLYATKLALYITLTCFVLQCLVIYAFDKKELQLVSKDKFPKSDCKCELVGFRCLKKLGSKIHLCFENQSAILFRSLWFHARKLYYWLSFLVMEVRRQDKEDIHPIRYLIWLLVFSVLFARNISE